MTLFATTLPGKISPSWMDHSNLVPYFFVDLELDAEAMQDLGSAEVVRKSIPLKLKKPKLKVKSSKSSKSKKEKKSSSTSEHKESSEGLKFLFFLI